MECAVQKVDKDYRIFLPQALLQRAKWISGDATLKAWMVVGNPGRCRLLSSVEFEGDASCKALRDAIDAAAGRPIGSLIEFDDEPFAAMGLRLLSIEITPPGPGWRMTLPRELAAIMEIRPKESSVAFLFPQQRIELWTLEAVRASLAFPLSGLI
jgi:hypothetical protein